MSHIDETVTVYKEEILKDHLLKVKVSKLFYQQNLSKVEIGKNLRFSRFKVAKLLEDAVNKGIVNIQINEPENSHFELENDLEKRIKIFRACVVDSSSEYTLSK